MEKPLGFTKNESRGPEGPRFVYLGITSAYLHALCLSWHLTPVHPPRTAQPHRRNLFEIAKLLQRIRFQLMLLQEASWLLPYTR